MKYSFCAVVLGVALGATSPALAADQFDLICKAQKESQRYRIDLAKNEWCADKCAVVQKIASVTSNMLSLRHHEPAFANDSLNYLRINRITGAWEWYDLDPKYRSIQDIKGFCEVAPFSGFADSPAKF